MKIVIATPLYPPDVAEPAPYVKELATRLKDTDDVTILAYNHIPEEIPGVKIVAIEKQAPMPIRLFHFTTTLYKLAQKSDVVYSQNGQSTELPLSIVALLLKKPFVLRLGDEAALRFAKKSFILSTIQRFAITQANVNIVHGDEMEEVLKEIVTDTKIYKIERPLTRPEILPFVTQNEDDMQIYNNSWRAHVDDLKNFFHHVKK